ncbi:hypothetical protein HNP38_003045 [Chryseobacterium defluvii]|uniref:Uncharacterized protein n=1 Tax=Chryseobacterium defluvii TaxID=160396 RepID=A0A840KDX0_9FLAO|nr:hypothetical protein [Chryseobacterium defluvii]MBB4807729.1 hypothetical protein [Chryseobacterium defluvii]
MMLLVSCKPVMLDTITTIEYTGDNCKEVIYDPKYRDRAEDLAATSEFITRQYFDFDNIYSDEYGVEDTMEMQSLTIDQINADIDKELKKIETLHLIELEGIEAFKQQKIKSLYTKRALLHVIKESFKNPEILKTNELTKNEMNLPLIFEKSKKNFNKNFSNYFLSTFGEYHGKKYMRQVNENKNINKVNELIIYSIFYPKLEELAEKERENNRNMYLEYKKLYQCKKDQ